MITDDLPWPELGNVSRGATRGNQGSKGVLGPPDDHGRAILQLRVQPGVLAVRLNPTATVWYRMLDNEVQRALKETKTYWRKARRRQDYDARADQDHMELHEWLQQLKDKAMAHLELLLQKGEITGPPYIMPDNLEFTFMRGFIERQRSGVPHNPRLRGLPRSEHHHVPSEELADEDQDARGSPESVSGPLKSPVSALSANRAGPSTSSTWTKFPSDTSPPSTELLHRVEAAQNALRQSRSRLRAARTASQDAFERYKHCTEQERILEAEVTRAEERLDELIHAFAQQSISAPDPSSSIATPVPGPSTSLQVHTQIHQRQQTQAHGAVQATSATTTPIITSTPNGTFDQERAYATIRALNPASQAPHQPQQQPAQQLTPYHQTHVYQQWAGVSQQFHGPPQRPASSISVSSAPGGLNMELATAQRYGTEMLGPGGASGGGNRGAEDWTTASGAGVSPENETVMMHAAPRVASPQRKHAREWGASASASAHEQAHQHMAALVEPGGDSASQPPRKRLTQVHSTPSIPIALSLGSPLTPTPSPHTPNPSHHNPQHQPSHTYHHGWTSFPGSTAPDPGSRHA